MRQERKENFNKEINVSIPYRCNETSMLFQRVARDIQVSIPYRCNETIKLVEILYPSAMFQFLIGAMRRRMATLMDDRRKEFQFLIGAMRQDSGTPVEYTVNCFNSL